MFNSDFWPTPRNVARDMWRELSGDVRYILEPNGGMGHLADVLKEPYTWEEAETELDDIAAAKNIDTTSEEYSERKYQRARSRVHREDYGDKVEIDVIESEPNFCQVLTGKGYTVVGYDWLSYDGTCYYDAIVMNPPFSNGDEHLLKAWNFLYKGEIVCLLNAETLRNPFTETRKKLVQLIEENQGRVTEIGKAFSTAERSTDVEVVRVYLKKLPPDDTFDLWATETTNESNPELEGEPDPNFPAIRDNLGNMVRWYEMANKHFIKGFEELRRGMLYLRQNKIKQYGHEDGRGYGDIAKSALDNAHGARADFLRTHRKDAWTSIFHQMEFDRWLDSKQQEQMLRDVARDMNLPFTEENIKGTLENVFLSRNKLFQQSVANVFDELCSHAIENGSGPVLPTNLQGRRHAEGWKTNDTYKVNDKLIFPNGCRYCEIFHEFKTYGYGDSGRIYTDLDRILCVLDGQPFDKCRTVGKALEHSFKLAGKLNGAGSFYNQIESQYFTGRFFKKGTVHLKWKRLDLLDAFNRTASAGKKWLGADTSFKKAAWREKPGYYCEHHGHEYVDGTCSRCERPEVDPLDTIACEYCRVVAEYTGQIECPIHVAIPVATRENEMLALSEPEHQSC